MARLLGTGVELRTGLVLAAALFGACTKLVDKGSGEIAVQDAAARLKFDARANIEEADSVLARAEQQQALWIPAREAMRAAQAAMENGQHEEAIRHAHLARELGQLGLEQTRYPLIEPYR